MKLFITVEIEPKDMDSLEQRQITDERIKRILSDALGEMLGIPTQMKITNLERKKNT